MSAITAAVFVQHKMNVFKTAKSTNISINKLCSAKIAILVVQKMVVVMIQNNVTYVRKIYAKSVKIIPHKLVYNA